MGDTGDHRVLAKTRASQRRTLLVLWTAVLLYLTKMRVLKYLGYDDDSVSSSASLRDRDRDDRDEDKDSSTVVISHERCSLNEREDDSDDAAGIFWTKKKKKKRKKERKRRKTIREIFRDFASTLAAIPPGMLFSVLRMTTCKNIIKKTTQF
jgi:hypothetical protein